MESKRINTHKFRPNPGLKLMDQVREVLRYHHYAYRTEQTYCQWILRYIYYFGGKTHPNLLGAPDVEKFLSHLATEGKVAASTQKQALTRISHEHCVDFQNITIFQEIRHCCNLFLNLHNVHQRSVHAAPSSSVFCQ
jgi:hypothetical protein